MASLAEEEIPFYQAFIRDCLNTGRQLHLQRQVISRESIAPALFMAS